MVAALTDYFGGGAMGTARRIVLLGDLNIAPLESDVWSHRQLLEVVSHTPVETEAGPWKCRRLRLRRRGAHGVPPDRKLYTWWSYRDQDWPPPIAADVSTMSGCRRPWRRIWSPPRSSATPEAGTSPATMCR